MTAFTTVAYPILGGVDKKVSGNVLPAPKLQAAENVYSDQTGSLRRRFGRTGLSTIDSAAASITGWVATATHQGRLLGFTPTKVYEYSETAARWFDKGRATSWKETTRNVSSPSNASPTGSSCDVAVTTTGYRVNAYDTHAFDGTNWLSKTVYTLFDSAGTRLAADVELASITNAAKKHSGIRCVVFGARLFLLYSDLNAPTNLKSFVIDTTSATTLASSLAGAAVNAITAGTLGAVVFDACANAARGPFVAYRSSTANTIKFGFLNTGGVLTNTDSTSSTSDADTISVAVDPNNTAHHAITYTRGLIPTDGYVCIRNWSGAAWSVIADSAAIENATLLSQIIRQACVWVDSFTVRVFYDGDVNVTYQQLRQATFTTAGVLTRRDVVLVRSFLVAKPFLVDGVAYCWVADEDSTLVGHTHYLIQASNGDLCGVSNQLVGDQPLTNALSHVAVLGTAYSYMTGYLSQVGAGTDSSRAAFREVTIDVLSTDSHVCVEDGDCTFVPSAVLQQYDGIGCTEVGFQFLVNSGRVTLGRSAGLGGLDATAGNSYSYRIIPEWVNAQGQREQGTDTGAMTVGGTALLWPAGSNTVTVNIGSHPWTRKQDATLMTPKRSRFVYAIYRTLKNPSSDSPHYRVGEVRSDVALDRVTFVDLMSDADAAVREQLNQDFELAPTPPPSGFILAAGNGRVFVAGLPDDPELCLYGKSRGHGEALSFNSGLQVQFPQSGGALTALAAMDEQLFGFTASSIYRVVGSGVSNAGVGAGFADPLLVTANAGALEHRGVARTPIGVFYRSATGISVLQPSVQPGDIGRPLDGFADSSAIAGVVVQPSLQLIHVFSAGRTYVYDYFHQQWYTWTQTSAGVPTLWRDRYVAIQDDMVCYGDTTQWQDITRGYTASITLGWERAPGTMQGDLAFRRIAITGNSLDAHYLDVRLSHDYDATVTQTVDSTIAAAGVLRTQFRVGRQKANSLQVTIRDAVLDAYGLDVVMATAGWRLNEVTFEVGVRISGLSARRVA